MEAMSAVHDRTYDQNVSPNGEECTESAKRRQILEGARKVFLAEGFDGASMGEIAKVAGVSQIVLATPAGREPLRSPHHRRETGAG